MPKKFSMRKDFTDFASEFAKESDRAAVILGASHLEILLYQLLQRFLLPSTTSADELLDSDRALGTFSAKITAAYRMGLIDAELCRALHLIRRIRNSFAHEAGATSLSLGSYRDRVREIVAPLLGNELFEKAVAAFQTENPEISETSVRFRAALTVIVVHLHLSHEADAPRISSNQAITLIPKNSHPNE